MTTSFAQAGHIGVTPGGLLGDTINLSCPNVGECGSPSGQVAPIDVVVVDPGQEIVGNGANDGSLAGFLFAGEFIDFFDTSMDINITGLLNATIRVSGIDDALLSAAEAADPNNIIQTVTFIDANSFEFRILVPPVASHPLT